MRRQFIIYSISIFVIIAIAYPFWPPLLWCLTLVVPIVLCGIYDMYQTKHTLWRNFPVFGRMRWLMENIRPMIHQYFIESDIEGTPVNRMFRSVVYQRSKGELDTVPYGTKVDIYRVGYEWMDHSLTAASADKLEQDPRVKVGGPDCKKPYMASIFNISAMSFGALSSNAIRALNSGAKEGSFAHNTGEGGISPYHLEFGGDLIWQIGTAYFGCRTKEGHFSDELFEEKATGDSVKMIEIKLSQGAKPGHGGILPAGKNYPEIAEIRGLEPYTQINSPPVHNAFSSPVDMMHFVQKLRNLSGGKPVGFKLTVGRKSEFVSLCLAMIKTGIKPDFITVDGGEGGTGAAPLEFSNSVGMPLRDGLAFVADCLEGFGLKKDIRIIASGKIFTGFHIIKNLALGADICASARGMMLALGCIQSLECNKNTCPTGVATQDPTLVRGLVVPVKSKRVASYHRETVESVVELLAASGAKETSRLNRSHIHRRISSRDICRYDEIYPYLQEGSLLKAPFPERFRQEMTEASAECFSPDYCMAFVGKDLERAG